MHGRSEKDEEMLCLDTKALKSCCGLLLTRSLGGAPGQRAGDVAVHAAQQSQTEARTVRYPEQHLASLACLGGAPQGVVDVNVH